MSTEERLAWAEKRFARLERRSRALTGLVVLLGCGLGLTWFMAADPPGLPVRGEIRSEQVDLSKLPVPKATPKASSPKDVVHDCLAAKQLIIVDDSGRARIVLGVLANEETKHQEAYVTVINQMEGDCGVVAVCSRENEAYMSCGPGYCGIHKRKTPNP